MADELDKAPTYWLTRFMILRLPGVIYAVAFLVLINEIVPQTGADGLLPVSIYLKQVANVLGSTGAGFERLPSIFWFGHADSTLLTWAWIGFLLSIVHKNDALPKGLFRKILREDLKVTIEDLKNYLD